MRSLKIYEINWSSICQIIHLPETEMRKVSFEKNHEITLNKLKWIYYWWFLCIWNLCGVVFQCRAIRGRRRSQLVSLGTIHLQRFTLKKALELCHSMLWTKLVFPDLKCTRGLIIIWTGLLFIWFTSVSQERVCFKTGQLQFSSWNKHF